MIPAWVAVLMALATFVIGSGFVWWFMRTDTLDAEARADAADADADNLYEALVAERAVTDRLREQAGTARALADNHVRSLELVLDTMGSD